MPSLPSLPFDPLIAIAVVVATACTDAIYVLFTNAVVKRRRFPAAAWSSVWYMLGSFAVITYTHHWIYVIFAAAGSFIGAYVTMTFLHPGPVYRRRRSAPPRRECQCRSENPLPPSGGGIGRGVQDRESFPHLLPPSPLTLPPRDLRELLAQDRGGKPSPARGEGKNNRANSLSYLPLAGRSDDAGALKQRSGSASETGGVGVG